MKFHEIKEPYVLIVAHARMGNLLYQLATGLKYAKDNNLNFYWAPLRADSARNYKTYIEFNDLLNTVFRNIANSYINEEFLISRPSEKNSYIQKGFKEVYKYGFLEDAFNYKPIPKNKNIVLFGQFYNSKYLDAILCQNIFSMPPEISKEIQKLYGDISNYTSLHVRRGDFLNGDGLCLNRGYYFKCILEFEQNTTFLVISDDIEWCKINFISENYNFVFSGKETSMSNTLVDFYLMTGCANNICSKSTFSWWGAFLNKNLSKKVFYPTSIGDVLHKRVPEDWIKVSILNIQLIHKVKNFFKLFRK